MFALYIKEINSFLSSLTGYIVILVFTTLNGLFLWVLPGHMNILDGGYATLEPLFYISPWVLLFLIPAISMRMIADEKKNGTLDLLYTRPVNELQIALAKFLSTLTLSVIALIPTLIYFIAVGKLGATPYNLDIGGTWGSYIGLVLLAAVYAAIGIFSSSLTSNVIVAFMVAVLFCFTAYAGFDYLGELMQSSVLGAKLSLLGIDAHYQSISRGVIDSRDIIYFLSAIGIFVYLTNLKLKSRLW